MIKPNPLLSSRVGLWPDKPATSPQQRAATRAKTAVARVAQAARLQQAKHSTRGNAK
ncbi:hypothetical protein [Sodaliphilus pleomorphus]|uniref:hypothetical protein n=1 Tax=Sodaliphilus pleomorphus TaxID=2606626 RepID=UPI0012AFBA56|nr:hypothetical protein [Sodaliphilus pleomorphus]